VQGGILLVGTHNFVKVDFRFAVVLLARFGGSFQQSCRNGGSHPGGLSVSRTEDADQILIGSSKLELAEFIICWQSGKAALRNQAGQRAAGYSPGQPGGELGRVYRFAVGSLGGATLAVGRLSGSGNPQTEK
jgi:hypothetical protein